VEIKTTGVFDLVALSTDTPSVGTKAYWDDTNKRLTTTVGSNVLVGAFVAAKANGVAVGRVYLDGAVR
jgi:predicted RecA/RadA family phage recombinase